MQTFPIIPNILRYINLLEYREKKTTFLAHCLEHFKCILCRSNVVHVAASFFHTNINWFSHKKYSYNQNIGIHKPHPWFYFTLVIMNLKFSRRNLKTPYVLKRMKQMITKKKQREFGSMKLKKCQTNLKLFQQFP